MQVISNSPTVVQKIKKALNMDGWSNIVTQLGMQGRDKRLAANVQWQRSGHGEMESFYAGDDMARTIVDLLPDEAMNKGYKIKGMKDDLAAEKVEDRLRELKFNEKFNLAWKQDRIHGGCGLFMVLEDGLMSEPRNDTKKLLALNLISSRDLFVSGTEDIEDSILSPNYKLPRQYSIAVSVGAKSYSGKIHASRIVRFPGIFLPEQLFISNGYWGDSLLGMLRDVIRNYSTSHDAVSATILDFSIPVLKMANLSQLMLANKDEAVMKRIEIINLAKSVGRMILLDADKESFEHATRNVTGLSDMMTKVEQRLVSASKSPATKLFGSSPASLTGGGEHESTNWYDFVQSQQQNYAKPRMTPVIRHIVRTEFADLCEDVNKIDIEFEPLWQMSGKEEAEIRKIQADTDAIYISNGVVDPSEISDSRFGGDTYSTDTNLDWDLREKLENDPTSNPAIPVKAPQEIPPNDPAKGAGARI